MGPFGVWAKVGARSRALASLFAAGFLILATVMLWPYVQVRFLNQAIAAEFPTSLARVSGLAGMLGFLAFGLIALELGQRIAKGTPIHEMLCSRPRGLRNMWSALWALAALLMLCFAVLVESIVILSARALELSATETRNLALAAALNVVIPALVGLLVGSVASSMRRRTTAYTAVIVTLLLISPMLQQVISGLSMASARPMSDAAILLTAPLLRLFALTAPETTWYQDPLYLAPIEASRWTLALLWVGSLTGLLLIPNRTRRGLALWSMATTLLAALWVASSWLDSVPRHDQSPSSAAYGFTLLDQRAIVGLPDETDSPTETDGIKAESYELDLVIDRRLTAQVKVGITGQDATTSSIPFTLFRGYRVSRVTDGAGKVLEFGQSGDVVRVEPASDGLYVFDYVGSGWRYYSNYQGVFLPSTFPWYPWPGEHRYYESRQLSNLIPVHETPPVPFSLKVQSGIPMYSNLGEPSSPVTRGRTVGLTLVGGNVVNQAVGAWRLVGPPSAPGVDPSTVERELNDLSVRFDIATPLELRVRTVFFNSSMSDPDGSFRFPLIRDDHALASADTPADIMSHQLAVGLFLANTPPERTSDDLFLLLRTYLEDEELFLENYKTYSRDRLAFEFASKIRTKGERAVVVRTLEYLRQRPPAVSPEEFVATL